MHPNITKFAMRSGLVLGLLFSCRFFLKIQENIITTAISFFLVAVILYVTYNFAVALREKEFGGSISYGKAFSFIILSFFFASLISAITKYIFFQFINPEYLTNIYEQSMLILESMQLPASTEKAEETIQKMLRPSSFAIITIWGNMFSSLFGALIIAGLVKKEKSIFDKETN